MAFNTPGESVGRRKVAKVSILHQICPAGKWSAGREIHKPFPSNYRSTGAPEASSAQQSRSKVESLWREEAVLAHQLPTQFCSLKGPGMNVINAGGIWDCLKKETGPIWQSYLETKGVSGQQKDQEAPERLRTKYIELFRCCDAKGIEEPWDRLSTLKVFFIPIPDLHKRLSKLFSFPFWKCKIL